MQQLTESLLYNSINLHKIKLTKDISAKCMRLYESFYPWTRIQKLPFNGKWTLLYRSKSKCLQLSNVLDVKASEIMAILWTLSVMRVH